MVIQLIEKVYHGNGSYIDFSYLQILYISMHGMVEYYKYNDNAL